MAESPADETTDEPLERLGALARDGLYTAVGLGVLAVNRAQAARRELFPDAEPTIAGVTDAVGIELREIALDVVAQTKAVLGIDQ